MPHGGPIGPRDINSFNSQVQFLTNRGYSVLQVNYRGSRGFGRAFKNSGRGQWGRKIEQDISTAVEQVTKQTSFKHTCAIGASYGGYSSVMLAILHPKQYDCVVARFGVFDLPLIFNDRNTKKSDYLQKVWSKVVGEYTPKLKDYSPVYFADLLKAPILITAGRLDTRASFEHSNRLKYVLEKTSMKLSTFIIDTQPMATQTPTIPSMN
ncbi:prolyl oligopeptidase family serine peptidase [Paraglaciecola aquimarina]|uniref:Prolyl oligopeptidase family serine peptidase n=1 Tax=Paraglaciecola aquimarina TaxID=1235557 RepID=A0ABU3SUN6_9ALTE|nr:prolyl oligopeptidase family serine peptidase [Paraglaciecola aquimarina]MDU0353667.1 prolyl oligopeptidase family serine peptidase [Paraglaciecola aquimarina]